MSVGMLAGLLVTGMLAGPAAATFRGHNGLVVFEVTERTTRGTFTFQVHTVRPDGRGEGALPCADGGVSECQEYPHVVSADGRLLAGVSVGRFPTAPYQIVYRAIDGGGVAVVPVPPISGYYPPNAVAGWSPDGRILTFLGSSGDGHVPSEWFLTDLSGRYRMVGAGGGRPPAWAPSGSQLVVAARYGSVSAPRRLFVESVDGTTRRLVSPVRAAAPSWSARNLIAFERPAARGNRTDIWAIRPDGTALRRIARNGRDPAWSPDGRRLLFQRLARGRDPSLYTVRADGTGVRRIGRGRFGGPDTESAAQAIWSPDSKRIAFTGHARRTESPLNLYTASATGRRLRRIFSGTAITWPVLSDWQSITTHGTAALS